MSSEVRRRRITSTNTCRTFELIEGDLPRECDLQFFFYYSFCRRMCPRISVQGNIFTENFFNHRHQVRTSWTGNHKVIFNNFSVAFFGFYLSNFVKNSNLHEANISQFFPHILWSYGLWDFMHNLQRLLGAKGLNFS